MTDSFLSVLVVDFVALSEAENLILLHHMSGIVSKLLLEVFDENVHRLALAVAHDWFSVVVDERSSLRCALNVVFISIRVILISRCHLHALSRSMLRHKLLYTI